MKTTLLLLIVVAAAVPAAAPQRARSAPDSPQVRKLSAVTWDLKTHKLVWVVQQGALRDGEFVPVSEERFEIAPDDATMAKATEVRGFDTREAASLHRLLDVLSLYCAESVAWWDQGHGTPLEPGTHPLKPSERPVRVAEPRPQSMPPARSAPPTLIAAKR